MTPQPKQRWEVLFNKDHLIIEILADGLYCKVLQIKDNHTNLFFVDKIIYTLLTQLKVYGIIWKDKMLYEITNWAKMEIY